MRFALAIAAALASVLVAHRLANGAGFGLSFADPDANGTVATGFVASPEDNFAYLSHVEQAASGAWTFVNAFAWEEQPPIYFNPLFLVLGKFASALGIGVSGALQLAGLAAAVIVVLGAYAIARRIGLRETAARWATVLVAFGSGLSAYGAAVSAPGGDALVGVDRTHQDTIAFSTFLVYPFQAVTLAVLTLAVLTTLRGQRWLAAALTLVGASIRPYECVLFIASFAIHALLTRDRARLSMLVWLALAALPAGSYALWVGDQPAWQDYARVTLEQIDIDRSAWLIGYGAFLPAAAFGAWAARGYANARWLGIWIALALALLVVLGVEQTKLASGLQLPLAVLAGAGMTAAQDRLRFVPTALVAAVLFLPTSANLLLRVHQAHRIDADLVLCGARVEAEKATRVLCDTSTGQLLPGLVACRVYCGHWSMTPSYPERRHRLVLAGCEVEPRRPSVATPAAFAMLVAETRPELLVLDDDAPAVAFARFEGYREVAIGSLRVFVPPSGR